MKRNFMIFYVGCGALVGIFVAIIIGKLLENLGKIMENPSIIPLFNSSIQETNKQSKQPPRLHSPRSQIQTPNKLRHYTITKYHLCFNSFKLERIPSRNIH
jgi:uncharacterized membrane protein YraQ (UPF0718 family)